MADVARLLETMHPMREPPPPAPVTPYLLMIAIGCVIALVILAVAWQMRHRRIALRIAAESALMASRRLAPGDRLAAQALLLRRVVRGMAGDEAARTQGAAWLARLDDVFRTRFFTQGDGIAYGENLYRPADAVDVEALDRSLGGLIGKLQPSKARA